VHTAMPQLDDNHHWLEEGLATYVEPIARVQHGVLSEESVWTDMLRDMPKGKPLSGDRGLDRTHTWARTYWGGAMFYFVADVRIRQQTNNRKGLQDALQAVVASGQTIAIDATPEAVFAFADKSVGVSVMLPLYQQVSEHAVPEDLNALWTALGVRSDGSGVVYNDQAPLASVRKAIFRPIRSAGYHNETSPSTRHKAVSQLSLQLLIGLLASSLLVFGSCGEANAQPSQLPMAAVVGCRVCAGPAAA